MSVYMRFEPTELCSGPCVLMLFAVLTFKKQKQTNKKTHENRLGVPAMALDSKQVKETV